MEDLRNFYTWGVSIPSGLAHSAQPHGSGFTHCGRFIQTVAQGGLVFLKDSVLMLFTDKAVSAKRELNAKGTRNKRFIARKGKPTLWFPVIQWLHVAYNCAIQIYGL